VHAPCGRLLLLLWESTASCGAASVHVAYLLVLASEAVVVPLRASCTVGCHGMWLVCVSLCRHSSVAGWTCCWQQWMTAVLLVFESLMAEFGRVVACSLQRILKPLYM
jgi:hypothetical protein